MRLSWLFEKKIKDKSEKLLKRLLQFRRKCGIIYKCEELTRATSQAWVGLHD